mmetsp:Transcript_1426/g.3688  ORF Transcript_1426/g.3688 Transcript_1426/m.3688 type:complete len:279 (-) Transcript_1426:248-1084(-)
MFCKSLAKSASRSMVLGGGELSSSWKDCAYQRCTSCTLSMSLSSLIRCRSTTRRASRMGSSWCRKQATWMSICSVAVLVGSTESSFWSRSPRPVSSSVFRETPVCRRSAASWIASCVLWSRSELRSVPGSDARPRAHTGRSGAGAAGRRRRSWCSPLPQSGMSLPQGRAAALRAASAAAAAGSSSGAVSTCVSGSGSIWVALTLSFVAAPWWKSPAALARLPRLPRGAARSGDGHGPATPDLTLATLATLILPRGSSRCPDQNPSLNTGPPWARVWTA